MLSFLHMFPIHMDRGKVVANGPEPLLEVGKISELESPHMASNQLVDEVQFLSQ